MEWLGELERAFATSLYPLRVPIAIGIVTAGLAMIWLGRRRGWFSAARRHPGRATALALAFLAVTLPAGWYLGSPLFIRTALEEPAPSIAPAPSVASIAGGAPPSGPISTAIAPAAPAPPTLQPRRSGEFRGADDFHFGRGTAAVIETAPGRWVLRFEQFSVRNGPNLHVYLSPDPKGYHRKAVDLGPLKATDGDFNTKVPPGTDVASVRSVVIWCKQFAVQFAVAPLS